MRRINSLGLIKVDNYADEPWLGGGTGTGTTTPTTPVKQSLTDTLKDIFGVAKEGAEVYNTIKSGSTGTTDMFPTSTPPPPPQENTSGKLLKYGLYAAGAGLLAWGGYQLLKDSKKKGK